MYIETCDLKTPQIYPLLVEGIIPRPIAWVSSQNSAGITNVAPYSFFTVASCNPPVLIITQVNPQDRKAKDTLVNLQETGECVINIVSADLAELMNASCADYPAEISEFDALNIAGIASQKVNVLGVKAAKVRYECSLREIVEIGKTPGSGTVMYLDVKGIYVADEVYQAQHINAHLLDAIGKLGGNVYSTTRDTFTLVRPTL